MSGSLALNAALDSPTFYTVVVTGYASAFLFLSGALRHGIPLGVGYGIWGPRGPVTAFVLLGFALDGGVPLTVAYGIRTACGVALTAVLCRVVFKERLTPTMAAGIVLIAIGVLCIEVGRPA